MLVGSQSAGGYIVNGKQSVTCCHLGKFADQMDKLETMFDSTLALEKAIC